MDRKPIPGGHVTTKDCGFTMNAMDDAQRDKLSTRITEAAPALRIWLSASEDLIKAYNLGLFGTDEIHRRMVADAEAAYDDARDVALKLLTVTRPHDTWPGRA